MFVEKLQRHDVEKIFKTIFGDSIILVDINPEQWKFDFANNTIVCIVNIKGEGRCALALTDNSIKLAKSTKRHSDYLQRIIDNNEYKTCLYKIFGIQYANYLKNNIALEM